MISSFKRLYKALPYIIILAFLLAACDTGGAATPTTVPTAPTEAATQAAPTEVPAATNTTAPSTSSNAPKMKDATTLNVGVFGDPESLDPAWAYDTASASVILCGR